MTCEDHGPECTGLGHENTRPKVGDGITGTPQDPDCMGELEVVLRRKFSVFRSNYTYIAGTDQERTDEQLQALTLQDIINEEFTSLREGDVSLYDIIDDIDYSEEAGQVTITEVKK